MAPALRWLWKEEAIGAVVGFLGHAGRVQGAVRKG